MAETLSDEKMDSCRRCEKPDVSEISFDDVRSKYIPPPAPVFSNSTEIEDNDKAVKAYRWRRRCWDSMELEHPAMTLEELGMEPENKGIIADFLSFVRDKEAYKKEGKDWKRGYFLYDLPGGADRSSAIIAAMANYLKFDIYNSNLTSLASVSELKDMLSSTRNRSLIAIQDFDHSAGMLPSLKNEPPVTTAAVEVKRLSNSTGSTKEIRNTVTDTKDNRAQLGRAYQSIDPIMFRSEKKDRREGSIGECLTMSVHGSDDATQRKLLPDRMSLTLFPELTSDQDVDDFDHCAVMLPDLNDKPLVSSLSTAAMEVNGHSNSTSSAERTRSTVTETKGYQEMSIDKPEAQATVKGTLDMKALMETVKEKTNRTVEIVPPKKDSAVGKTLFSKVHGGGRGCQYPACTKGAQGRTMFCKAHGGGKRCTFLGCTKGAEGSTPFCKGHGGGKRCLFQGGGYCPNSVHGGTSFCVIHGGGKRCSAPECTRSARGRTNFCVRHGGGKRCKSDGCLKSAEGATLFCVIHSAGKRCAVPECTKFARGRTDFCIPHGRGTLLSTTDFDAADIRAHLGGVYQSDPIMFYSEKKDKGEELNEECLAKSVLSFDDPTKRKLLLDRTSLTLFPELKSQDDCAAKPAMLPDLNDTDLNDKLLVLSLSTAAMEVNRHSNSTISTEKIQSTVTETKGYQEMSIDKPEAHVTVKGTLDMKALMETVKEKTNSMVEIVPPKKDSAVGKTLFSKVHGGGRQCQYPACTKGAQGCTIFCKAHGGGKRCTFLGCTKGAEGSTPFCKGHGGGKSCLFQGGGYCRKSVHGGTLFCVIHGGGKRCAVPECTKSARGRTDFCVCHGGGKRCKSEGCLKRAQGSTDFCKAHGGRKQCSFITREVNEKHSEAGKTGGDSGRESTVSDWLKFIDSLLSSCADEQILVFTTKHRDRHDAALLHPDYKNIFIHTSLPQPLALPDGGEILPLDSSEQKPLVDFETANNMAYHRGVLLSNSHLEYHQHVNSRWEDAVKSLGAKCIRRELVIHRVSLAKCIRRQHGIQQWPFQQNWATMKGYSLGDKRPLEVIHLSTDGKLVSRLQRIYISWLGRFSPPHSALPGGGLIVGPIALSSSEFAATNNIAQHVGQDQRGSGASDSENERTREQEDPKEINTSINSDDLRRHFGSITEDDLKRLYKKRTRKDAAEILGVSVSTFKRTCRACGINEWPPVEERKGVEQKKRRKKAEWRPPDQHGGNNPSSKCKTMATNGQTEMQNEMVGHLEERNDFFPDFVEGPNEAGGFCERAFQLKNQSMQSTTYPNPNGCLVPHPHIASTQILGENMGSLEDLRNWFASQEEPLLEGHVSECIQWTVLSCSNPTSSQPIPTILHTTASSEDRINLLPPQDEPLLQGHISRSMGTVLLCSDPAPSQAMPTIPHTMGSSEDQRNLFASVEELFSEEYVSGSINSTIPSSSNLPLRQPMPTIPHTAGSLDDWSSLKEPFPAGHVSGSSDLPPSQPMPPIPHTTLPHMAPLLTERQDTRSVKLKATYGNTTIKFHFPLTHGFSELKEEVSKRLEFELGSFKFEYKDEDGDLVLIACDEDVREYLRLLTSLGNQVIKLFILDKIPNTTERQDTRSVMLKAAHGNTTIKFHFPLTYGFSELKENVLKRLEFELGRFRVEYEDEDGVLILIACDEDVRDYLQFLTSSGNQVIKPLVLKKVPNTTNGSETRESLKRKRQ